MAEYPLTQSSWGRARQDTRSVFHTIRFWVVEMISAPIVALGMYLAIPNSASTVIKTIVPIAAFSMWMLAVLGGVFLLSLLVAPYRQRNEARRLILTQRKVPLPNRESLIRAISVIRDKAIDLKMRQDNLNFKNRNRENPQEELAERDNAWFAYLDAKQDLETERLVAGDNFRAIIDNLIMFIDYHINDSMKMVTAKDKPETLKTIPFMTQLENNIEQAVRDLDALSLQEPNRGGFPT